MADPLHSTEFIDNTTAAAFIPELWSTSVLVARENKLVFANLVNRTFESQLKHGDKLHVGSIGNLAARSKGINAAITYETITETLKTITVSTHEYAAIAIEDITEVQTNRSLMTDYSTKLGYALALSVDDVLAGLIDDFSHTVGTLATENSWDDYIRADQFLNDADVPMEGRVMVVSPAAQAGLMKYDKFLSSDYDFVHGGGSPETSLERAYRRSLLSIYPIYMSNNVEGSNSVGHDNAMFQKEALALVMQMTPTVKHAYDIDFLTDKMAVENLYGTEEMRDDHGVFIKGA
jgi:hypothetical protein